jgi:hypothetical protein
MQTERVRGIEVGALPGGGVQVTRRGKEKVPPCAILGRGKE